MSNTLFIPACGDRIVLTQDWAFDLHNERRNYQFAESLGVKFKDHSWNTTETIPIVLPAGTELECDRIYIKKAYPSFNSVTWKVVKDGKGRTKQRFWVKLADCNRIFFTLKADALRQDRAKD